VEVATVGDIVNLHGRTVPLGDDLEFISDMARFSESLLTEKAIRKKYRLADDVWEKLADDDNLVRAIEAESVRRVRDGSAKKEKAQKLVVAAPDVLSGILLDENANARHRIDSCKVLNDFASNGPGDTAPASDRFIISIVLSADGVPHTEHYNKSIAVDVNDTGPHDVDTTQGVIAALTAKKSTEGGNGDAL
jgi:hypothetical protein